MKNKKDDIDNYNFDVDKEKENLESEYKKIMFKKLIVTTIIIIIILFIYVRFM